MNHTITAPKGFRAGSAACGLKREGKADLGILVCDGPAACAACFTQNKVLAAPVQISREHVKDGMMQAAVVNSGNANACTGERGLADAAAMARRLAEKLQVPAREVLVAGTGVIGEFLDMTKVADGIDRAWGALGDDAKAGEGFAQAILTTDTRTKQAYREFDLDGRTIRLAGTAKGSGMISPNMATMLAFVTTDARLSPNALRGHLAQAVGRSFNRITVDGRTSTNDMVAVFASGKACDEPLGSAWQSPFGEHLYELCNELAMAIVADGEGATKVFHVMVTGGTSATQVHRIARTIVDDLLVKTAIHGADPNWGRIICAAGSAGVDFNPHTATCAIGNVPIFQAGMAADFDHQAVAEIMKGNDIWITLDLHAGDASDVMHSCDLSKEYIDINALYHT